MRLMTRKKILMTMCLFLSLNSFGQEVNVYSYRKPHLIKPLFDRFTQNTGIKVNAVFAQKGMLERLRNEGRNSPADLIFTVDIGRISDFKEAGLIQPVVSDVLMKNIPDNFRDPENYWFGLTSRARIIVVSKDRVEVGEVDSYEDLAEPRLQGKVCTRQGKHPYMVALTASVIAEYGYDGAKSWLTGLKNNLARKPQGNDRAQVKGIYSGICDVAVLNHYYMVKMLADDEQKKWANSVKIIFPNQDGRGVHMNVSGVSLTKYAPHPDAAIKLMEFLSSSEGQGLYAEKNGEYPVKPGVNPQNLVASWGTFKQDSLGLSRIASLRKRAVKLADEVKYNE